MFFGQEVKSGQNKASAMSLETDIKLSQAVLDPSSKGKQKDPVCLLAEIQGKSFILAVLDPSQSWQVPLDLLLAAGTQVKFYLKGQGTIHLTGYAFQDDDQDYEMGPVSSDDEMEEESPDEAESKHAAKKIKVKNSPAKTNGVAKASAAAKMKASGDDTMHDSDDDDSDDEDLSFGSDDDDDENEDESSDMDDIDLEDALDGSDDDDDDVDDDDDDVDDDDDDDDSD